MAEIEKVGLALPESSSVALGIRAKWGKCGNHHLTVSSVSELVVGRYLPQQYNRHCVQAGELTTLGPSAERMERGLGDLGRMSLLGFHTSSHEGLRCCVFRSGCPHEVSVYWRPSLERISGVCISWYMRA